MNKTKSEKDDELTRQDEDSFPASDPPSITQPNTGTGAPGEHTSSDTGVEAELARQQAEKEKKD